MRPVLHPLILAAVVVSLAGVASADTVLFDFGDDAEGWTSTGPITTDFGEQAYGVVGKGRAHVGNFNLAGWGMTDYSPAVDLSAYTGIRVYARIRSIAGQPPLTGTPILKVGVSIGDAEWMGDATLTTSYQAFAFDFSALVPDGQVATEPISASQLSDPALVIKLKIYSAGHTGTAAIDYDQVVALGSGGQITIAAGAVIYDFNDYSNPCYPDNWQFFGYPLTDFGADVNAEDGHGARTHADWTGCDVYGYPRCDFVGSKVGAGIMNPSPSCTAGGVDDINLDLSLGTGLSIRVKDDIASGYGGTLGARLQLQFIDADGTTAVTTRTVVGKAWINRTQPLTADWATYKFYFKGLDYSWDNGSSVAGTESGLNLNHIKGMKLLWRRDTAADVNVFRFDKITLITDAVVMWPDVDADGDIDLPDFAQFQAYFGATTSPGTRMDADYDGTVEFDDFQTWVDGYQGPGVTESFRPWCY